MENDYFMDGGILQYEQPTWHSLPAPPKTDGLLESALSAIVNSNSNGRELIGKYAFAHPGPGSSILPGDSGFAERAARFSSFGSRSFNCRSSQGGSGLPPQVNPGRKLHRILSSPSLKLEESQETQPQNHTKVNQGHFRDSEENSSGTGSRPASKKRKSKQLPSSAAQPQATQTRTDPTAKRAKSTQDKEDNDNEYDKEADPPKDYIHVRARRGQATDSHSLAERVRREKISERMKLLQDIVPGCNKVTGKALMLEEIINYVESLQRQVEYLSMKLASTPPSIEFNTSNHFQNDIFQPNWSMQTSSMQQLDAYGMDERHGFQLPTTDAFMSDVDELQLNSLFEGDLRTIVDMGFRDNTLYTG